MKHRHGFTLIEVLVAVVLLFISITAVSQIYKTTLFASEKATQVVEAAKVVPLLLPTIQARLADHPLQNQVEQQGVLFGSQFTWTARLVERAPPRPQFSMEDDPQASADKFYLWQVTIDVQSPDYSDSYQTHMLSWGNK